MDESDGREGEGRALSVDRDDGVQAGTPFRTPDGFRASADPADDAKGKDAESKPARSVGLLDMLKKGRAALRKRLGGAGGQGQGNGGGARLGNGLAGRPSAFFPAPGRPGMMGRPNGGWAPGVRQSMMPPGTGAFRRPGMGPPGANVFPGYGMPPQVYAQFGQQGVPPWHPPAPQQGHMPGHGYPAAPVRRPFRGYPQSPRRPGFWG